MDRDIIYCMQFCSSDQSAHSLIPSQRNDDLIHRSVLLHRNWLSWHATQS